MPDRERLKRLSARLARGDSIDWDREESAASTSGEREAIQQLRVVAAMAAFGDTARSVDAEPDLASSISIARSVAGSDGAPTPFTETSRSEPWLSPGDRWGHLEILEPVGRGGFGEVYRARDTRLDRIVALKLLTGEAPDAAEEVVREARLLARVHHSHVVTVHGADRIGGRVGIWMEFVRGETLDRVLKDRGALDAREAALIGIDLCRALSAVHAAGIAHRDVKLANVMRAEGGRIVLMDFGLGHETPRRPGRSEPGRRLSGTPLFMAPEVLRGAREDARSDVYSLGVVLFALVTGRLPVEASSLSKLLERHDNRDVKRARDFRPDLPEAFVLVLDHALDPDPRTRFQTAGETEKALLVSLGAAVLESGGRDRRRPGGWMVPVLALVTILVLAGLSVALWNTSRHPATPVSPRAPFAELPDQTLTGEIGGGLYGLAVGGAGDVDGDGFDDVLVGAVGVSPGGTSSGKVYLYRGGKNGLDPKPAWTFGAAVPGQYLGQSVAPFTDLNLDGIPDLVLGAPGSTPENVGEVLVFRGSRGGPASVPSQTLTGGTATKTLYGFAVSTGDVNHDGRDDLLVGEPYYPSGNRGRALLYMSVGDSLETEPAWTFSGPESSQVGACVSLGGDVNNDGYGDAAIGAPLANFEGPGSANGAAYVFLGSATGLDTIPIVLPGRQAGALFGRDIFFAGDVDADGFQDLFVGGEAGSNGEQSEGIAEIYFGSPGGVSPYGSVLLEPNVMGANFGGHAAPLGDVDGDGCDDVFVGALRYQRIEPRAGAAFIYSGSRSRAIRRSWFRVAPKGGTWYGAAGGIAGDVNGDGFRDFVVAGPSWDSDAGENTGLVEIFLNTRRR